MAIRNFFAGLMLAVTAGAVVAGPAIFAASPVQAEPVVIRDPGDVVLNLSVEDWVNTKTAKVRIVVQAVMDGAKSGKVRGEALAALDRVAKADWQVTGFYQSQDASGLERWQINVEARIDEPKLGGLRDRVRAASRKGMKLTVQGIDFIPTLAEREQTQAGLRLWIYKKVAEEIAVLKTVFPDRTYRAGSIDFVGSSSARPMPRRMYKSARMESRAMAADAAPAPAAVSVGTLMKLRASVVLSTDAKVASDKDSQ